MADDTVFADALETGSATRAAISRWGLAVLGGVMTVLTVGQLVVRTPPVVPTLIQYSAIIPFAVAVTLFGLRLAWIVEETAFIGRVTRWGVVGGAAMFLLASWAVVSKVIVDVQPPDVMRTVLGGTTLGLLAGSLIGYYHEQSKQRARQLAAVKQRQLTHLVSLLSHDLQSPLSVAKHNVDIARTEPGDDSEALDNIEQSLTQIQTLVEKTLDLVDSEPGHSDLQELRLDALARETWDIIETADATLVIADEISVTADRQRMASLLQNLFENAVTHAGSGVTVRIGSLPDGFYIEDDGPGIPPDERQNVREIGYQLNRGGSGIGLAIVEQVVKEHEWELTITESSDGGARFEFTCGSRDDSETLPPTLRLTQSGDR